MHAHQMIDLLAASGQHHFTMDYAVKTLDVSAVATRAALRRIKDRGLIASPYRGFFVIVPPEYRVLGCPPAEHFIDQLMEFIGQPYYIGLLSAAEFHGAAHQRPQSLQVMVPVSRPRIDCGQVRISFIARADVAQMPVSMVNTPRGAVRYATPEITALELLGYPGQAGGLNNVATVLQELAESLDSRGLTAAAALCPVAWSQRLGHMLDFLGFNSTADALLPFVNEHANCNIPLRRSIGVAGSPRNPKWKVIINTSVEPDL